MGMNNTSRWKRFIDGSIVASWVAVGQTLGQALNYLFNHSQFTEFFEHASGAIFGLVAAAFIYLRGDHTDSKNNLKNSLDEIAFYIPKV